MIWVSVSKKDSSRLDKLIRRAGSEAGLSGDSLREEDSGQTTVLVTMDDASPPLQTVISNQRSLFHGRVLLHKSRTKRRGTRGLGTGDGAE